MYSCCRLTDRFLPAQEPAVALVSEPTAKRNSAGGHTVPSSATASTNLNTAQEYGQRHHTYELEEEEEEEEEGQEFCATARPVPSSAVPISWRPEVPPGGSRIHRARTAACMDANASYRRRGPAREATRHWGQEEHPDCGELLHLLHALRYLVSGSAASLVDHLIARFIDLMKRDC